MLQDFFGDSRTVPLKVADGTFGVPAHGPRHIPGPEQGDRLPSAFTLGPRKVECRHPASGLIDADDDAIAGLTGAFWHDRYWCDGLCSYLQTSGTDRTSTDESRLVCADYQKVCVRSRGTHFVDRRSFAQFGSHLHGRVPLNSQQLGCTEEVATRRANPGPSGVGKIGKLEQYVHKYYFGGFAHCRRVPRSPCHGKVARQRIVHTDDDGVCHEDPSVR